jgi:glycosidase
VVNGMPLVYGGQEAGLNKSLKFFDKDTIEWKDHPNAALYKSLFKLKHENQALWNGGWGGEMVRIFNDKPNEVISFAREKKDDKVISVINFTDKPVTVKLNSKYQKGIYKDWFSGNIFDLKGNDILSLPGWGYLVLVK